MGGRNEPTRRVEVDQRPDDQCSDERRLEERLIPDRKDGRDRAPKARQLPVVRFVAGRDLEREGPVTSGGRELKSKKTRHRWYPA